jgi:hypothetical protein
VIKLFCSLELSVVEQTYIKKKRKKEKEKERNTINKLTKEKKDHLEV